MSVAPLEVATASQVISGFEPGDQIRLFFDLVDLQTSSPIAVTGCVTGALVSDVLGQVDAPVPGTYSLTVQVPLSGIVQVVFKVFNTSSSEDLVADLDDVILQACVASVSSYSQEMPDPEECGSDALWEGFLVTGDMDCFIDMLRDCTRAGGVPGGDGDADILLLTDTTGSMGGYISTIKAVFSPLAASVTALLPAVDFRWSACDYKDYEDGGPYANDINVGQVFDADPALSQTAINSWTASGGGDGPEQNLSALLWVAQNWVSSLTGRADSQKVIVWGGDIHGWEDGDKGLDYPKLQETINALAAIGVKVFGINSGAAGAGIDGIAASGTQRQASAICNGTGGILSNEVSQDDADAIASLIANAIFTSVEIPADVTVSLLEGPAYIEPSRNKNLDGSYMRQFAVANAGRTRSETPEDCRDFCWPFAIEDHCVSCECVSGPIRFLPGYNADIREEPRDNAIVIAGSIGAGDGEACEEVPICLGETPPLGRETLSGSLRCHEIVRSFNGIGKRYFDIRGGNGVVVTPVPEQHRVIIDVGLHDQALCPDLPADEPVDCILPDMDPCICGPENIDDFECPDGAIATTAEPGAPDPGPCGGPCEWLATTDSWELVSGGCSDDCACAEPAYPGALDETAYTDCVESSGSEEGCLLGNPDFTDFAMGGIASPAPVAPWVATGQVSGTDSGLGFPTFPFPGPATVIRLEGTAAGDAVLEQTATVTAGLQYKVTYLKFGPRGRSTIEILDGAGNELDIDEVIPPDTGSDDKIIIVTATDTSITLRFTAEEFISRSGRGILDIGYGCVELYN